jgi:GTPase
MKLALLGRPNVGKSTLFNRLTGKGHALVDPTPGVTRDWREGKAYFYGLEFDILDTAGLDYSKDDLQTRMEKQTKQAAELADLLAFIVDAKEGITPIDSMVFDWILAMNKPFILIANKCDSNKDAWYLSESYKFGDPTFISAAHGNGMSELFDAILPFVKELKSPEEDAESVEEEKKPISCAIIGRPNAGKSSLINKILGYERLLVGPQAGITRDSIATDFEYKDKILRLVDTAGQRRRSKVEFGLESMSVRDAWRAIKYARCVVLVVDANCPLEKQDIHMASNVIKEGRALIIAINKWDLCHDQKALLDHTANRLSHVLPQASGISVIPISAKNGYGIDRLISEIEKTDIKWDKRVSTGQLNKWLNIATQKHPPPRTARGSLKVKYITQTKARPPTFTIFTNHIEIIKGSYIRYLENGLRDNFGFQGLPIRFNFKKSANPYER